MKRKKKTPSKEHNPWHAGFRDAIEAVFEPYRNVLELKFEHQLTAEALRMDALIIKKKRNASIQHDIAAFFKTWNVIEYKSPGSRFSGQDFHKVLAYAHLYASKECGTLWSEGTITIIRTGEPESVLKYVTERGYTIAKRRNADNEVWAYDLVDYEIPIRIIQSEHLAESEHLLLRYFRKDLDVTTLKKVLEEGQVRWHIGLRQAYLQVLLDVNQDQFEEVWAMNSPTIEQVLEKSGWADKMRQQERQVWEKRLQQAEAERQRAEAENAALKEQLRLSQQR
jgi:hypothetical protein